MMKTVKRIALALPILCLAAAPVVAMPGVWDMPMAMSELHLLPEGDCATAQLTYREKGRGCDIDTALLAKTQLYDGVVEQYGDWSCECPCGHAWIRKMGGCDCADCPYYAGER